MTYLLAKACIRCGDLKLLGEFYTHPRMADGHLNVCKPCVKARVKTHRRENDSVHEYDRARAHFRPEGFKEREIERARQRHARQPLKKYAHGVVAKAIKKGLLVRESCEECGAEKSEAHHDDYSEPMMVRWLCTLHHRRWHASNEAYYPVPF